MDFVFYNREKEDFEPITSFKEWVKLKGNAYIPTEEEYWWEDVSYTTRDFSTDDSEFYIEHCARMDFLRDFYKADLVADALEDFGDFIHFGFFIVKNDRIVKFITQDYSDGLYEGVMACKEKQQ